jgi:hypothetical protein
MHIPEQNDPRATSALFPGAAFRNRARPVVSSFSAEKYHGHDALHMILPRVRDPSLYLCQNDDDASVTHSGGIQSA